MGVQELREKLFAVGSSFERVNRDDIAGIDSILEYIDTIIYWLQNSKTFTGYKSRLEPGVLFEGRPGTGKTLCAKYIATTSGARFINVRDWPIEGDLISAKDVKSLFESARNYYSSTGQPVVLFWDEFEGYTQNRMLPSVDSKQASVVSELTAQLDGIEGKCEGILLIGCTNYKDNIDDALLRAGRMGLHIRFNSPDRAGKAKLLLHYLSKVNVVEDFDYEGVSFFFEDTDTAASVQEAVERIWLKSIIAAVKTKTDPIVTAEIANAVLLDRLLGPPPPFMELKPDSYKRVAIHEAGHAIVAQALGVEVMIVTIQPGEDSFGRVFLRQPSDKIATVLDIKNQIACLLGSVYAEQLADLDRSVGVHNDTSHATQLAITLANSAGNYDLLNFHGFEQRARAVGGNPMSEYTKSYFDDRVRDVMVDCQALASSAVNGYGQYRLNRLANRLVEHVTWTGPQFHKEFMSA